MKLQGDSKLMKFQEEQEVALELENKVGLQQHTLSHLVASIRKEYGLFIVAGNLDYEPQLWSIMMVPNKLKKVHYTIKIK